MTLDEAIKHAIEVAEKHEKRLKVYENLDEDRPLFSEEETECRLCAEEHRQLATWLKELKQLREQMSYSEKSNKWIPISKEVPEENGYYLVTTMFNQVYCDYWNRVAFDSSETVIAWMPKPEPYKAESEEGQ